MPLAVMKGSVICDILQTCLCNLLQFFTAAKMKISGDFFFFLSFAQNMNCGYMLEMPY